MLTVALAVVGNVALAVVMMLMTRLITPNHALIKQLGNSLSQVA